MPEMQEVRIVDEQMVAYMTGKYLTDVVISPSHPRLTRFGWSDTIRDFGKFQGSRTKAKYIRWDFERGSLVIHFGMTGVLSLPGVIISPKEQSWIAATFQFCNSGKEELVHLLDGRKFAWIWSGVQSQEPYRYLGPTIEELDVCQFIRVARKFPHSTIRQFLLDQRRISGLGNILVSESLFTANINPGTKIKDISDIFLEFLRDAVAKNVALAHFWGGASVAIWRRPDGTKGQYQNHLSVYGREKEPCILCKGPISRQSVGGRSSYWCPHCQPPGVF